MRRTSPQHATWFSLAALLLVGAALGTAACSEDDGSAGGGATSNGANGGNGATAGAPAGGGGSGAFGGTGATGGSTTTTNVGGSEGGSGQGGLGGTGGQAPEWGALGGSCGQIDASELESPDPFLFQNEIDFGDQVFDYALLSDGGKQMWDDPNSGGSSHYSEVLSFEILHRCELAELLKTETFISYIPNPPAETDFLVSIDGLKVGVSVVRAFLYSPVDPQPYPLDTAIAKITEKLLDIQDSTASVLPEDAWSKQILHVIAWDATDAQTVVTALDSITTDVKADTIVLVTATNGTDEFIYYE